MRTEGLQLPNTTQKSGFIHSIDENGSIVKKKRNSVIDSLQFKRWFGNSKVKNDDGTPKVLYHQTGADFSVFSTNHPAAGAHDSETPNGIFLKDNDHDIGLDGKKQMAVYARMEHPFHKGRERAKGQSIRTGAQGVRVREDDPTRLSSGRSKPCMKPFSSVEHTSPPITTPSRISMFSSITSARPS